MKLSFLSVGVLLPFVLLGNPVQAENEAWDYAATVYVWGPETTATVGTPLGSVTGELSFSDALDALDFAFMGTLSAQRGKLSLVFDTIYFDMSDDLAEAVGPGIVSASLTSEIRVVNAYALWQVAAPANGRLDIGTGVRLFSMDNRARLSGAVTTSFSLSDDWVDPLLALRYRADFGPDWYGLIFADVGVGGGSDQTWQGVAALGYRFSDSFSVEGGYRVLQAERSEGSSVIDIEMSGPIVGATWRF